MTAITAGQMGVILATPTYGIVAGRTTGWMMNATDTSDVGGVIYVPPGWTTYHADLLWAPKDTAAGSVFWRLDIGPVTVGAVAPDPPTGVGVAAASPGVTGRVVSTRLRTNVSATALSGAVVAIECLREGANGADTYPSDAGLIALVLTRAS